MANTFKQGDQLRVTKASKQLAVGTLVTFVRNSGIAGKVLVSAPGKQLEWERFLETDFAPSNAQKFSAGDSVVVTDALASGLPLGSIHTVDRYSNGGDRTALKLTGNKYMGRYPQTAFAPAAALDIGKLTRGDKLTVTKATDGLTIGQTVTYRRQSTGMPGMIYVDGSHNRIDAANFALPVAAPAPAQNPKLTKLFAEIEKMLNDGCTEIKIQSTGNSVYVDGTSVKRFSSRVNG